ncbi:hypothetical protein SprV_0501899800 [Sparganum proliferum]
MRFQHRLVDIIQLFLILVQAHQSVGPVVLMAKPKHEDIRPNPVIMIPGDGGCQAFAELTNTQSSAFPIWVDLRYLITPGSFSKYFKLNFDSDTGRTYDNDNVKVTFPGWGETWSVDNLDSRPHDATEYFGEITRTFISNNSFYQTNFTVRGTPFDFRKAPSKQSFALFLLLDENENFGPQLKSLIEETYANGGNNRVVIVAHSMGTLYGLHFLKSQSIAWKKRYVKAFVAVAGPLGGAVKALKIEASGDNFGIYFASSLWFRELQRSMPSLAFLLPNPRLWPSDETLIFTPDKNYTAHDYEEFFNDIGYPEGFQMYMNTRDLVDGTTGPTGVDEVYCVHGSNVSTAAAMVYAPPSTFVSPFPDQSPTILFDDGDGTVNERSLAVCSRWKDVRYTVLPGADHLGIVRDPRFLQQLLDIANARAGRQRYRNFIPWEELTPTNRKPPSPTTIPISALPISVL